MTSRNTITIVLEAIAELLPMRRTKQVTRQDLKAWVTAHYGVELDDRWLDVLLREHIVALRRHIERKKAQKDATIEAAASSLSFSVLSISSAALLKYHRSSAHSATVVKQ